MAMTILTAPATDAPGHNDLIYVVDSTNKANAGYQYILDVYISSTKVATMKNWPNPANSNYGVFNITKIIQNYLSSDYFKPSATQEAVVPFVSYQIKLSERYGSTTNVDVVTDSTRKAWNAALSYLDYVVDNDFANHLDSFITDRPAQAVSLEDGEDYYVCAFGTGYDNVQIKFYPKKNLNGTMASSATVAVSGNTMINIGTSRFDPSANVSYSVQLRNGSTLVGMPIRINVGACELYEPVVLHFLNRLGGYETLHMRLVSRKTLKAERKRAGSIGYQVASGGAVTYKDSRNVVYDTDKVYTATYGHSMKLTSGALTDEQFEWLAELISSPVVYVEQTVRGELLYVPCIVKTDEVEFKKRVNDKVSTMQIDIEFSEPNAVQLR